MQPEDEPGTAMVAALGRLVRRTAGMERAELGAGPGYAAPIPPLTTCPMSQPSEAR
ncbi:MULTISPECIES: hypothetical protein [Streptomyces]|uniref:XRE family transcriptional regulator n=1 Tax=Streptomyces glycanivorans TaxID=3033808 RepID=A0ABY9JMF1_9ACTN|nr:MULTISPECIES: hypothetical protein [unclassified Streptomyces]WLQ67929.1 hypothetical protein P8A20_32130 [Streptomyces sp. Alt3]WSQ88604.1 hypothetical protein OG722_31505 [Streptomyces sp. NBC_01212]WSR05390.1 hypothetical protein OG265_04995 [Streptomyces sp. NBC_01208]WSR52000.1 hypothetical protein OG279_32100 [Streptomyces sp. NBC_01201]